ncbi:hypothetical protein, partial [Streptococcus iniae]
MKKFKMKKRYYILLLILGVMAITQIQTYLNQKESRDGIYYLVDRDMNTHTASLDTNSYIKITGETLVLKEGEELNTYKYDRESAEFKDGSKVYYVLYTDGD